MSFEKLKKGLHVYFGVVIFMVLLFSVCGMVDKNSNSSSSNDVSKTESGLIGKWEFIGTDNNIFLEIKNDNTIINKIGSSHTFEGKIINISSTARQFVIKGTMTFNSDYNSNQSSMTNIVPYYLSDDKKELIILDLIFGNPLEGTLLKK